MPARYLPASLVLLAAAATAIAAEPNAQEDIALTAKQTSDAFAAAGFRKQKDGWHACDDPGTASYTPGAIEQIADLNGDGLPEAVISEGSGYCFGAAGQGYYLVSAQKDGSWKLMDFGEGMPRFLSTKGTDGWPDLEVGGPGFCFAVLRWDGQQYVQNRYQYEGKACLP